MVLHPSTFEYITPSERQLIQMALLRERTADYARQLELGIPEGPDKTFILRSLRSLAMWINVAITRYQDGSPRSALDPGENREDNR